MAVETRVFGTFANDGSVGVVAWGTPANAAASDGNRTTASLTGGQTTQYIKATNSSHDSGSTLAIGDIITDIFFRVIRLKSGFAGANVRDWKAYPIEGGIIQTSTNYADTLSDWTTSDVSADYQQTGTLPSAATVLASDWGFAFAAQNQNGSSGAVAEIDQILAANIVFTPGPTAALTGTAIETPSNVTRETHIVAGGRTIIITLTSDTWVASGATFDAQRQNIINGLDSGGAEANGWDAVVKAGEAVTAVVRTSATVVTITLSAFASYNITANETITCTIPGTALTGGNALVAVPTFRVVPTIARNVNLGGLGIGRANPPRKYGSPRRAIVPAGWWQIRPR